MADETKWETLDPQVAPKMLTLGSLSAEQAKKLEQFKATIQDKKGEHDLELVKWLIARQWDLGKAVAMYQKSMQWRSRFLTNNYPTNHTDPKCPKVLRIRDGSHLCVESMGNLSSEAAALVPVEEILKYHIYSMELANKIRNDFLKENGYKEMAQSFVVEDLADIGTGHLQMVSILQLFTQIDSDNYPETLRKVVIVNVPSIFSFIWSAVQYFWDENQKSKFQFVQAGTDHGAVLKQAIHPDYLPKSYGGNLDYVLPPKRPIEEVKKELSAIKAKQYLSDHVPRSGTLEKTVPVKRGTVVHYEFKTIDNDVSFGIKFKHEKGVIEHHQVERVPSNTVPVFGRIVSEQEGHWVFHWDNTYSWTRGKDLLYSFEVVHVE